MVFTVTILGFFLKRKKMFQHHFVLICSFIMIMRGFSQCLTHRFCITFTGFSNVEEEVLGYFSSTFQKFKLGQSVAKRKLTSMTHPRDFSQLSYYTMLAKNGTLELKFKAERYLECCCLSSVMRKANFMRTDDALADHQKRLEDQYLPTSYLWIHRRFLKFNGDAFESKPASDP